MTPILWTTWGLGEQALTKPRIGIGIDRLPVGFVRAYYSEISAVSGRPTSGSPSPLSQGRSWFGAEGLSRR